jgi:hypothetical protein
MRPSRQSGLREGGLFPGRVIGDFGKSIALSRRLGMDAEVDKIGETIGTAAPRVAKKEE